MKFVERTTRVRSSRLSWLMTATWLSPLVLITTTILNNQQVALGDRWAERLAQVEPFNEDAHLAPLSSSRQLLADKFMPGLGRVLLLNTYLGPKSSLDMPTTFNIYRPGRFTRGIKFSAQTPDLASKEQNRAPLDPTLDYQYNLEMMLESNFNTTKRTVLMIPGYLSEHEETWARDAMHSWLELFGDEVNVVLVSWADSNRCIYSRAVAHTVLVARQVTVFLHYLAQLGGTSLKDQDFLDRVHLIGHSLGAHIAGFVGADLGGRVGRITGLDPAGPSFDTYPPDQRLDRGDAQLVEVLHTNAGRMKYIKALSGLLMRAISAFSSSEATAHSSSEWTGETTAWFGIDAHLGHIDYYANSGRTQDGCTGSLHICDHNRAGDIYVDMLKREVELRARNLSSANAPERSRLWAFRASNYETFLGGAQMSGLCPELIQIESHLSPPEVKKNLGRCALPLLDFMTPTRELIQELRNEFHINFDAQGRSEEEQPRFYFRTLTGPTDARQSAQNHYVSDHYLLKVHLDREASYWNPLMCSLSVNLLMESNERLNVYVSEFDQKNALLALPFAHPAGTLAHESLQELLSMLANGTSSGRSFTKLFETLFPRTISFNFAKLPQAASTPSSSSSVAAAAAAAAATATTGNATSALGSCKLSIKAVEVHPVSVYTQSNLGALYGGRPLIPGRSLEFVSASELAERLASSPEMITLSRTINSLGLSLGSAIVAS